MILFITGDFGVGKDTVADAIVEHLGDSVAKKIRSYATRKPRYEGEDTHIFVEKDETKLPDNDTVAWTEIGGEYYWTESEQFDDMWFSVYVIDTCGLNMAINWLERNSPETDMIVQVVREDRSDISEERKNRSHKECPMIHQPDFIIKNNNTIDALKWKAKMVVNTGVIGGKTCIL